MCIHNFIQDILCKSAAANSLSKYVSIYKTQNTVTFGIFWLLLLHSIREYSRQETKDDYIGLCIAVLFILNHIQQHFQCFRHIDIREFTFQRLKVGHFYLYGKKKFHKYFKYTGLTLKFNTSSQGSCSCDKPFK